jgi:hypothetical protein
MTASKGFLVDSNSSPLKNVGLSFDASGVPMVITQDSSGNQVSTPVGGTGSTPASSVSPKAAGAGAVGTGTTYARQDHAHPVNDGVDIGLINSTQKTQIAGGGTVAVLNAGKTALKDPAGGADVNLGVSTFAGLTDKASADIVGTNTGVATALANRIPYAASWNASTNVVTGVTGLTSLANSNPGAQTAFVNTATGTTTVAYLGSITSVNFNDEVLWNPIAGAWTLLPYNGPSVLGIFATTGAITYPAASWNGYSVSIGSSAPYQTYTSNGSAWVMDDAATINASIAANTTNITSNTNALAQIGKPLGISGATTLSFATHNGENLVCSSTPALTINTGLGAAFGCSIKGAFTTAGSATITDLRSTTGTAFCCLVQSDTAGTGLTYDLVGTK